MEKINLLSLNIWGGQLFDDLKTFVENKKEEIDIFCFQEVFHTETDKEWSFDAKVNILSDLRKLLEDDFILFYHPAACNSDYKTRVTDYEVEYGLCSFVRKDKFLIQGAGERYVFMTKYADDGPTGLNNRNVQYLELEFGGKEFTVFNFHGMWTPEGKGDNEERIAQSRKIKSLINSYKTPTILCGDFNLSPDTESIEILEKGLKNLIKEHGIVNTRSSHYKKENRFADYILTSEQIEVEEFKVLEDEVSDHLPLQLTFSLR